MTYKEQEKEAFNLFSSYHPMDFLSDVVSWAILQS